MTVVACAISLSGAATVCLEPWETERDARWAAQTLAGAGYRIGWWPEPVEVQPGSGYWSVATVFTPIGTRVGDVKFQGQLRAATGAWLSGPGGGDE